MNLKDHIRSIPDYPKKGILFRDITTLIKNNNAFVKTIDEMVIKSKKFKVDKIMDGLVNWEGSQTQDGERFNLNSNHQNQNADKGTICFDNYLIRKKNRALEKAKSRSLNG